MDFLEHGGGLLLIPFFTKILKIDSKTARATSITIVLFLILSSSFFYFKNGAINWNVAIYCAIGGFIGSFFGSKILKNLSSNFLELIFIIFLFYSGIKMIF